MENNNNINELEEMRGQMQMLREKLEKQEIVNDKLVRNTVTAKMSWIKKYVISEFLVIPFVALLWWPICQEYELSMFNYFFTIGGALLDAIMDYRVNVASLKSSKVETNSLTETISRLVEMKQERKKIFFMMASLCIVWAVETSIEACAGHGDLYKYLAMFIGGCIGAYIAIRIYRKMQRTNKELIEQLRDLGKYE